MAFLSFETQTRLATPPILVAANVHNTIRRRKEEGWEAESAARH